MCALSPETKRIAESLLLVPSSSIYSPITPIANSGRKRKLGEISNGLGSGQKGKLVPRFARCMQCDIQFDVTENEEGGCFWHEGEKEPDEESEVWDTVDINQQALGDLKDNEDFLKGFRWTCCGEQGDAKGCNRGVHKILGVEGDEIDEDDERDSEDDEGDSGEDEDEDEDENDEDDEDDEDEVRVVKVQRLEGRGPSTGTGWAAVSSRGAVSAGNGGMETNSLIEISDDEEGEGGYDEEEDDDDDDNGRYAVEPDDEESEPEQDHSTLY